MSLFDHKVRVMSEGLARVVDRRTFLQKTGSALFAGIAALAAGQMLSGTAEAGRPDRSVPNRPRCAPPGPFCNIDGYNEPNGCQGANCYQHLSGGTIYPCKVYYAFYQNGCWTSVDGGGYWTCCDCDCRNSSGQRVATCGCAAYSNNPVPVPMNPSHKARG